MKDFQVVSSLVQLKALVAGLYGRIDALSEPSPPAVDFAVDMFDREDQDTLGPYWSNTEYALRSGMVVRSAGVTPLLGTTGYLQVNSTQLQFPTYNIELPIGATSAYALAGAVVYAADLNSPEFTCVVTAAVPRYDNQPPPKSPASSSSAYYSHYITAATTEFIAPVAQVAAGAGVCVANSQNAVFGVATQSALCPAQQMSQASTGASASTPETMLSIITRGSTQPVVPIAVDPAIVDTSPINSSYVAAILSGSHDVMQVGTNTIAAGCSGDTVTISANGVGLFSGTPATVSRKSRSRAGIMTGPFNAVAAYAAAPNAAVGGVSSFKVWRNDIPEPPNETGHGTYTNGRWQYTDKYHTPVTDASGTVIRNEDGTVAGYTYDPEA